MLRPSARTLRPLALASSLVAGLAACDAKEAAPPVVAAEKCSETPAPADAAAPKTDAATPASDAFAELAALDNRSPVPLQPMMAWHQKQNMMAHLVAIQGIVDATEVTGVQPTVFQDFSGGLGLVPISGHDVWAFG